MRFEVVRFDEPLATFTARPLEPTGRRVWLPSLPETTTLVIGSAQTEAHFDSDRLDRADIEIVKRRSGGGAVLVSVDDLVWFDILLDRTDELWDNDLGRSFNWLGQTIAAGLASLGHSTEPTIQPDQRTRWADSFCFAGVGHGELLLGDRKVVGISQRRTRDAARFQVAVLRRWNGAAHAELLQLDDTTRSSTAQELELVARGIPNSPEQILDAILSKLL